MGPGNILNVIACISISLFIGGAWSGLTTGSARSPVYEDCTPRIQHFPPECEMTKGRQMREEKEGSDPAELHRKVVGQRDRDSGKVGGGVLVLFHPPLYSSRQGNMPAGHR